MITSPIRVSGAIMPCQTPKRSAWIQPPEAACADSAEPAMQALSDRVTTSRPAIHNVRRMGSTPGPMIPSLAMPGERAPFLATRT